MKPMHIEQAKSLVSDFFSALIGVAGTITYKITDPINASIFPDEINKFEGSYNGLYLIWSKMDESVIYIGISEDIPKRIYTHIGTGFSWTRNGHEAAFPGCTLAASRPRLSESTQNLLKKAEFNITAVLLDPPYAASLLEAFLLFWGHHNNCKPEINVEL